MGNSLNKRVLILDVELSKAIYYAFPSYKPVKLNLKDKIQDQFMLTAAWKWWGEDETHLVTVLDDKKRLRKDPTDDYHVVKTLCEQVEKADIVIGHNSDAFDIKHLAFMAYTHGLDALPVTHSIDTLKQARKRFKNDSLSMDEICKRRGLTHKTDVPNKNQVWNDATDGCPEAIQIIGDYNIDDVDVQEEMFEDMLPWMVNIPSLHLKEGAESKGRICAACGEEHDFQWRGYWYNKQRTTKHRRFKCMSCGTWGTDKSVNLLSKTYLKAQELLGA